jgi:hypothetical protein
MNLMYKKLGCNWELLLQKLGGNVQISSNIEYNSLFNSFIISCVREINQNVAKCVSFDVVG